MSTTPNLKKASKTRQRTPTLALIVLTILFTSLFWKIVVNSNGAESGSSNRPFQEQEATGTNNQLSATNAQTLDLCSKQSQGFFTDISDKHWELMRDRVRTRVNHCTSAKTHCPADWNAQVGRAGAWYQDNYEPDFNCWHERRIGGLGHGPRWVCDPHRIAQKRSNCLVYSFVVPSNHADDKDFVNASFEEGVLKDISPNCEIHVFMPGEEYKSFDAAVVNKVHYHDWGISQNQSLEAGKHAKTMQQTINELGHSGRTIDLFKLDCNGCEFSAHEEWFNADVTIRQISFTAHAAPRGVNNVFKKLQEEWYVTFHKEAVTKLGGGAGTVFDYAMIKMDGSFFEGMNVDIG